MRIPGRHARARAEKVKKDSEKLDAIRFILSRQQALNATIWEADAENALEAIEKMARDGIESSVYYL